MNFQTSSTTRMTLGVGGDLTTFPLAGQNAIFNEDGVDTDFRVESDTQSHAFYVNGGNNSVGINTSAPDGALTVVGTATSGDLLARFQHGVNDNAVKAIRVNAPNASGTHGYVDLGVDPETTQGGLAVSTSSGGLIAGQANLTSYAAIIWDSNRHVTMPGQPAFQVKKSGSQNNLPVSSTTTITFDTEVFDQNGDFANNTFTAPVTGKYQFNIHLRLQALDTAATYYQLKLETSNRTYIFTLDPNGFGEDLDYYSIFYGTLADMDASDTAYLALIQSGGTQQTNIHVESYLSGILLA